MFIPRRLVKHVKDSTTLSVAELRSAFRDGRVRLSPAGGADFVDVIPDTLVFEEDTVLLDGREIRPNTQQFTAILNKPRATISTARDPRGKGDLGPWLREMPPGTFPVGRLDRDTTGLLLFTTDGNLANCVLRPEHHTDKLYWLWLDEHFEADDPRLRALTDTSDPRYDAAQRVEIYHQTQHYVELHLTLDQGKHRQIRRMCRALGLRLLHLHRKRIGPIDVEGLDTGELRELTPVEVQALWTATGGEETLRRRKIQALGRLAAELTAGGQSNPRLEAWLRDGAGEAS